MNKIFKNSLFVLVMGFSGFLHAADVAKEPAKEVAKEQPKEIVKEEVKKEPSPVGIWLTEEKDSKIEVYQNGDTLEGKIVWLKEPNEADGKAKVDIHNPDEKLKSRPIQNLVFIMGFKKEKDQNKWTDGSVYDPKSGKTYHGWIKLVDEKKLQLRGYVGISLFGRTAEWTRSSL